MIQIESSVVTSRSAAEVFAFVSDQTNAPRWQKDLHEVRRVTPGPVGVGSEHVFVRRFAGRTIESRNRFVAFEPDRFVEFEIPHGWITGKASYAVEPSGGGSRLTSRMDLRCHGPMRLLEPLLAPVMRRDVERDDRELVRLLESRQ